MKATLFEEPVDQYSCVERAWHKQVHEREGPVIFYRSRPGEWQGQPEQWSIKYVLEGECAFEIDGQWCDVFGGFAFVVPAQCPYRSQVRVAKTLSLFGRELVRANPEPGIAISGVFMLEPQEQSALHARVADLRALKSSASGVGPETGIGVNLENLFPLPQAWVNLYQRMHAWLEGGEGRVRTAVRLLRARHFITANFKSQDACSRAADTANMTRSHFSRQYSSLFGQSPRQYLVEYRSAVARSLLQSGARSVESVAAQLGYRHASSLAHLFQRQQLNNPRNHRINR